MRFRRDDNTFIRAWSVHAAAVLADQHPAYRDTALELLAAAERQEAPSVRARIRQTRRTFRLVLDAAITQEL